MAQSRSAEPVHTQASTGALVPADHIHGAAQVQPTKRHHVCVHFTMPLLWNQNKCFPLIYLKADFFNLTRIEYI